MKVVSLVVRLECPHCVGTGVEKIGDAWFACQGCKGAKTIPGEIPWEDFEKLIKGLEVLIRKGDRR